MHTCTPPQKMRLREIFGERVSFELPERTQSGHDTSSPSPIIGDHIPAAIVQPTGQEELIALVHFANSEKIALTPRGRATSGYGGAIPTHGGILVDFCLMQHVLDIQPDGQDYTVTVEPGMIWEELEDLLEEIGLALRVYPTSAPDSTVGGWLAQGGAGIGAYEFGYFADNVVRARAVLPDGTVREFSDDGLKYIRDAEGITGLIDQIELRVRIHTETSVKAYAFGTASDMQLALREIRNAELPIWSITFLDPMLARLKNQIPFPTIQEADSERERPILPEAFITQIAYPASRQPEIDPILAYLVEPFGTRLDPQVAQCEWRERYTPVRNGHFNPLRIPADVIVPVERLEELLDRLKEQTKLPLAFHGTVIQGKEITVHTLVPGSEHVETFAAAYALARSVIEAAKETGGRGYATGMYFTEDRTNILGKGRVDDLELFKATWDPNHIMNPDKVIAHNPLTRVLAYAVTGEVLAKTRFARLLRRQ